MQSDRGPEKNVFAIQLIIILVAVGLTAVGFAVFRGSGRIQVLVHDPASSTVTVKTTISQDQPFSLSDLPTKSPDAQQSADLPASSVAERAFPAAEEDGLVESDAGNTVPLSGSVDLNTASSEELQTVPGIGPVLAERIIEYRETSGGFTGIEEIREVKGIGEKTFQKIREYITVG